MMALNPFHLPTDDSNTNTNALLHQDTKGSSSSATISTNDVINALPFQDSGSNDNTNVNSTNDVISMIALNPFHLHTDDSNTNTVMHHQHTSGANLSSIEASPTLASTFTPTAMSSTPEPTL
jgi:hypothetical protein